MKISTLSLRKYTLICSILFASSITLAQTADFNVQHVQDDIGNSGGNNTSFTPVTSLNNAVALPNNNRKSHAGSNGATGTTYQGDDLSGARVLTGTGTLSYFRESGSSGSNMRFNSSIWEYVGPPGGDNEMIVRGRYTVNLNGGTNSTTQALSGIANANKCIPIITGILNNATNQDADSGTAIAYLESTATLRVQKGSNANNVTVYVTVVEFTGSNWTVLHGDSGNASADSGTMTLRNNSNGTGSATNVSNWNEALIFGQHRGDTATSGSNDAIADNWPTFAPGSNNQRVDWTFHGNHDSNGTNSNRHFVHVLANSEMTVSRFQNTSNTAGATNINITSAGLSNINEALIIGSSTSSGSGQAYARGWRNYYLNSTTQAAHWSHRSGNTMSHEIQIADLSGLTTSSSCATTISTFPYTEGFESGLGDWTQVTGADDEDWTREAGGTPSGNTGPSGPNGGTWYMFTEASYGNDNKDFYLDSACFDLSTATSATFSFYYHMYGSQMGDLFVDVSTDGGSTYSTNLWSQIGYVQTSDTQDWELVNINLAAYVGQTINLRFRGETGNDYRSDMAIDDISLTTSVVSGPEINLTGNATSILDGDTTPSVTDDTDFGTVNTTAGTNVNTFTIQNTGTASLSVGSITIGGTNAADFTVTSSPASSVAASGSTTFNITFNPSADGLRTASVSIVNDDSDENPYNFNIQGTGFTPVPEINITGNSNTITDGDTTPSVTDDTDFGSVDFTSGTNVNTFTIENTGTASLSVGTITISGTNAADFTVTSSPSSSVAASGSTTFDITFNPSAVGLRTASVSIVNGDSNENPYNFNIRGTGTTATYSNVVVSVNWPSWSSENRVEVYTPSGTLLTTIDNGYTGGVNNNYTTTENLGCLQDLNNYYITMYDSYGDGWQGGSANVTVTSGGSTVLTNNGSSTTSAGVGVNVMFNVSGGGGNEIEITGLGNTINDGDTTPSITDDTDFGDVDVSSGTNTNTFTINNIGCSNLNLTGSGPTYISITGAHAGDFSVTTNPSSTITGGNSTNFDITFNPSATGLRTASISISNDDSNENPYNFNVQGTGITPVPEIGITGNSIKIVDGDTTPDPADDTDFGSVAVTGSTNSNTFTIENSGTLALTVGAITISGANASDFTVTASPAASVAALSSTTFEITFDPSAVGIRNATISIVNNDNDENPYNFNLRGTGTTAGVCTTTVSLFPYEESFETGFGLWTQGLNTLEDDFDWSRTTNSTPSGSTGPNGAVDGNYYIFTEATGNNNSDTILFSPCFDLTSATNPRLTLFYHMYGGGTGDLTLELSTDNGLTYPTVLLANNGQTHGSTNSSFTPVSFDLSGYIGQTVKLRLTGDTTGASNGDMAVDMVTVEDKPTPIVAPGGVTADLAMWLKADDGLSYTNGESVTSWIDQGLGSNAKVNRTGHAPTYYDNTTRNVNFNPVIEFDNSYTALNIDNDYSHDSSSSEFLTGDYGFYTQEVFIVVIPDDTPVNNSFGFMDVFCSDAHLDTQATDGTGIGFGNYTNRINGEVIVYAHDSYDNSPGDGYAVAEIGTGSNYNNVGIINTRNNTSDTRQELYYNANNIETNQNDIAEYMNTEDSRWWIGRSEGWEASLNARVAEVITYSSRKDDASLTQERNRIQSYLGIKYGITLGVNGTSQDYVDSSGNVIWDQSSDSANYNYDIAGIGRDDASELNQKQSRSVNNAADGTGRTEGILTFGLTDIYDTNKLNQSENATTLHDKEFLIWGNNGANLNLAATTVSVNMSAGISPALTTNVSFTAMQRVWKVVEVGGDIPSMKVRIPQDAIRNIIPPGDYYMFISSTGVFDPTADYRIMRSDGNGNLETDYDFDGTKYITFGYAPRVVVERSVYFDGNVDYIDMEDALDLNPTGFTISAWIKRDAADTGTKSILSKRDVAYTQGYDFSILNNNRLHFSWKNGGPAQVISPSTAIPDDEWHHVAAIYNGTSVSIYIDGIIARTENRTPPGDTNESFYIAAAGKNSPIQHFRGNIDEVRVWDTDITPTQLRFIMNQEIEDNAAFVAGKVLPTTITKNDVATIPWSELAGYYPMSVYTYTNTEDASNNNNQGALRNLNTVDRQTAPLPYESQSDGNWTTNATWLNNTVQTLPNAMSIVDSSEPIEWNIVRVNHDVTVGTETALGRDRQVLGMYVGSGAELTIDGNNFDATAGNGLTVSHYIKLDGKIDLEGQSQFVQGIDSDLDPTSSGSLEKDQQGTADVYTYNYWSSPVGATNATTNNNNYSVSDVMYDGVNPINFTNSGYDGSDGGTITIADYWIWKFANQPDDDYSAWQHVRQSGTILAGEGYTMKGPGSGGVVDEQNYVFLGKPNNGDINLTINAGNDYLVGNPYASAIDANTFITDNGPNITGAGANPLISGTLYFWEHWGGGSHNLHEYQGGYATYNFSGGVGAPSLGTNDPDVGTGGTPTKVPARYIPVSQGFFVVGESNGSINFNNGQRIYRKESSGTSIFVRENMNGSAANYDAQNVDDRMKFRIGFNSINTIHRQLLLTIDETTTTGYDWAFDAKTYDSQMDDLFWMIDDEKYNIQGSNEAEPESVYPLGVITSDDGLNSITIDQLENVPDEVEIYIHDLDDDSYHNLRENDFEIYLPAGEYYDRFELTFMDNSDTLSTEETLIKTVDVYYDNETQNIVLLNPNFVDVKSIEMFNIIGQNITKIDNISELDYSEYEVKNLSTGAYIIKIDTLSGLISKKVLVK